MLMVKGNYIIDLERAIKEGNKTTDVLNMILSYLDFKPCEIRIYNLLLKKPQTIKQIEDQLKISERTIRKHIDELHKNGLITKSVEEGKRLKYVYSAVPPTEVWRRLQERIQHTFNEISKVLESKAFVL
jgi:predicted DNA-binding transcriptional regulator